MSRFLGPLVAVGIAVAGFILVGLHGPWRFAREIQCGLLLIVVLTLLVAVSGRARDWLLASAAFLVGLIVLEGVALALEKPSVTFSDSGLLHARPVVGWGPTRPGVYRSVKTAADGHIIYDVTATIDDQLNRRTLSGKQPGTVAFFGDSFTYGDGLNDSDTLPQQFADLTQRKIAVQNLAFSGWSPSQNLAALQAGLYDRVLFTPRHFFLMTAPWHIERTSCAGQYAVSPEPRYVLEGDNLVHDGQCATKLAMTWHDFIKSFAIYRVLPSRERPPSREDVATYVKIVGTFVEAAKKKYGVDTTVIWIADPAYCKAAGIDEQELIRSVKATGADMIDEPLPTIADPNLYVIQGDGHPTALANHARARQVDAFLTARHPAVLSARQETH